MTERKKIDFWKKPTQSSLRPYQRQNVTRPIAFVQPIIPSQKDDSKDSEPSSDEEADEVLDPGAVEDEAEVHTGFRASFPLSFGKQESKVISLENVHLKTQRPTVGGVKSAAVGEELLVNRFGTKGFGESALPKKVEVYVENERSRLPTNCHDDEELTAGSRMPSRDHGKQGSEDDESPIVGPPMPSRHHGKQIDDDEDGPMVGPPMPSRALIEGSSSDEDEEDDTADDNSGDEFRVPLSNEIVLKGHTKVVSSLAVDPTGSRVLTGGYDYTVKMYDFQGMNAQLRSFRHLEPSEGHQVRSLSWSPTADMFIVVTGSAQAKIFDRDGFTLGEFLKGDMYIRDLKNTKGHISGLTAGQWHPKDREKALTSSEDGSLRIWDVTDFKSQKQVIKPRLARPGRVSVSTCCWGQDGRCLAGGLADGSVQVWNVKAGWGSRPDIYIEKAHEGGDDVTGLCISADGYTLLSRSTDCTMKVWDLRQTKRAVQVFDGLPNSYAQTNVSFSPDERLILTGTSVERAGLTGGLLILFSKSKLELVRKVGLSATQSVVCTYWHPRLNQIFATVGDKKEGGTHVLYDPAISERGALVCVARAPRKKSADDFELKPVIHNPHALPMFRDDPSRKRQREKARSDPIKSKRPDLPVTGPGFGGRVGTTKGSLLTQYLMKEGGLIKETWMDEDPREAILKHAEAAANDPQIIAPAYAETQPKTLFYESEEDKED
ncbi:WD repeat-containing protein 70 [Marchantia polymorpha subsp. ruderalis]|nr:hypothetical protein MARPO_0020s0160 [Marchantia polymorpha]BBN09954.1 hypothetical protein Mp_4g24010 [Marchantia polymorpha subsp. ruderalis]PTQ44529.1 hypothetical protein MARPO_0020s0160 [Marchantia polymorpha]PTQ44530.1 hypothetical protein MARPO_0020s0160 [Marchantia polymorpha]BBN09955.1 hypothetical protein Mp_4g24010 [Marchantia polymorpha subsp. ruderalis]|eukprot:PTQ44528.1 hypothetical protein MARPO_0020s0160 [Marchantia polymorpha]